MATDPAIRPMESADVAVLTAYEPVGQDFARSMWGKQQRGESLLLVAWVGGTPVGSCEIAWSSPPELRNLNVREEHRGRGVGTALIRAAHDAIGDGAAVTIGVATDNPRARCLYERLGYTATGRFTTTTYRYVDNDGHQRTATETDEWMIRKPEGPDGAQADGGVEISLVETAALDHVQVLALYDAVGWTAYTRDPETLWRAMEGSSAIAVARQAGRMIGLARIISDGATIAYIQDILVHPDHQRRGVGRRLFATVIAPFDAVRQKVLITDVEPEQRDFYLSLGFHHVSDDATPPGRAFARFDE